MNHLQRLTALTAIELSSMSERQKYLAGETEYKEFRDVTNRSEIAERARRTAENLLVGARKSNSYDAKMLTADAELYEDLANAIDELTDKLKASQMANKVLADRIDKHCKGRDGR